MIPTEVAERILVEVSQDKPPAREDSPEEAKFREQLYAEVAEIRAQGLQVDIPNEINVQDSEEDRQSENFDPTDGPEPTDSDESDEPSKEDESSDSNPNDKPLTRMPGATKPSPPTET